MNTVKKSLDALRACEQALRMAVAEAAHAGEYGDLELVAGWARQIGALIPKEAGAQPVTRPTPGVMRFKKSAQGAYPKFHRDADGLVKVGYSKKSKAEYEHRAPETLLNSVVSHLSEWKSSKKLIGAEEIVASVARDLGAAPSYQVYVVLGWLMSLGVIKRHGRSGYSVGKPADVAATVSRVWQELSTKGR